MSKRIQITLEDREYKQIQLAARSRGLSVAAWVREALNKARKNESTEDVAAKLAAIRKATRLNYPTADIDQMIAEIEQGYKARS